MTVNGVLPADIEAAWGQGRKDATGCLTANTARGLIEAWGLDRFRKSQIHRLALIEAEYAAKSKTLQDDFRSRDLKAMGEK